MSLIGKKHYRRRLAFLALMNYPRLPTRATNKKHLWLWLARLYYFFKVSVTTNFKERSEIKYAGGGRNCIFGRTSP